MPLDGVIAASRVYPVAKHLKKLFSNRMNTFACLYQGALVKQPGTAAAIARLPGVPMITT
nr:hypothetical protein [uncultured Noviherbaspirillum sp.]